MFFVSSRGALIVFATNVSIRRECEFRDYYPTVRGWRSGVKGKSQERVFADCSFSVRQLFTVFDGFSLTENALLSAPI